jgi:hypothetical protein
VSRPRHNNCPIALDAPMQIAFWHFARLMLDEDVIDRPQFDRLEKALEFEVSRLREESRHAAAEHRQRMEDRPWWRRALSPRP